MRKAIAMHLEELGAAGAKHASSSYVEVSA